jgi:hypothetical protein
MQEGPNPYQAPATAVPVPQPSPPRVQPAAATDTRALFAPPALKLVLMTFGTLGLYLVYWFYRNWKTIREVEGSEAWPFWRAVFSPIWSYGCFRAMASIAEGRHRELAFSPGMLALAYFLLNLSARLPDPWWVFCFFVFLPLLPVNSLARQYNQAEGIGDEAAEHYSALNLLAIIIVGGLVALGFLGVLLGH